MNNKQDKKFFEKIRGNEQPLFFIMGPCVIESESHTLKVAEFLKKLSEKLNFNLIFKSSFDKANRTSIDGFRGAGLIEGAKILSRVKSEFDLPIITDVHESWQAAEVVSFADILQVPAFLCRQTDLLLAIGRTGKTINLKKGQFVTADAIEKSAKKIESTSNKSIWLCERGYAFGYGDLIVDFRNFTLMKSYQRPVIFDVTHSVQKPSGQGNCSGGDRGFVADLAIAAVAQGIAGLFLEVHDNPEKALCDGPNSLRLSQLEEFIKYLIELDSLVKSKEKPLIS